MGTRGAGDSMRAKRRGERPVPDWKETILIPSRDKLSSTSLSFTRRVGKGMRIRAGSVCALRARGLWNCFDKATEFGFSRPMKSTGFVGFLCLTLLAVRASEPFQELELWPMGAPGEKGNIGEERDTTIATDQLIAGKPVIRLGKVSKPTIRIYRPPADKNSGAAVLVFPGGGYHILAMDLEGTEVCDWLNSIGVTGVLLKYRVPKREGLEKH